MGVVSACIFVQSTHPWRSQDDSGSLEHGGTDEERAHWLEVLAKQAWGKGGQGGVPEIQAWKGRG